MWAEWAAAWRARAGETATRGPALHCGSGGGGRCNRQQPLGGRGTPPVCRSPRLCGLQLCWPWPLPPSVPSCTSCKPQGPPPCNCCKPGWIPPRGLCTATALGRSIAAHFSQTEFPSPHFSELPGSEADIHIGHSLISPKDQAGLSGHPTSLRHIIGAQSRQPAEVLLESNHNSFCLVSVTVAQVLTHPVDSPSWRPGHSPTHPHASVWGN